MKTIVNLECAIDVGKNLNNIFSSHNYPVQAMDTLIKIEATTSRFYVCIPALLEAKKFPNLVDYLRIGFEKVMKEYCDECNKRIKELKK